VKVNIGPYTSWVGPYQIAEKILFWMDRYEDDRVHNFGTWLDKNVPGLTRLCTWIESKKKRKIKVHIDGYDVWSMDHTLGLIVLPMLNKLKEVKHGSPFVDLEDVPPHLRYTTKEDWDTQKSFKFYDEYEPKEGEIDIHARWDWVISEMIFAFEHLVDDSWENEYSSGEIDIKFVPCEDNPKLSTMEDGPNHTFVCDYEGMKKVYARMDNGFRLFGKYYRNLWD
jgi:hypothetical protein